MRTDTFLAFDRIFASPRLRRLTGGTVVGGVFLASLIVIVFLAQEVIRDLRLLESANSDNIQWTLTQAEVEFLEFESTLRPSGGNADLEKIREEFDIFFSRIQTLRNSALYRELNASDEYANALSVIQAYLDATVDTIDAGDNDLRAALPELLLRTSLLRPSVRALANSGLFHFAKVSDERRTAISVTLLRLAVVSALLFGALGLLALYSSAVSRLTLQRGRALAEANVRMNTILSTSLDGVIVSDTSGRILDFNQAAERIFQRKLSDVKGRTIGEIIVPPHLRQAHDQGIARMHQTGETRVVGRGRVRLEAMRADGSLFPVELALQSAKSGDTKIIIGFLRDISAMVEAETELLDARDRALAGEKAKADFLAVMSHEIRTPLNGVLGNLSLLEETELSGAQDRYVSNMQVSGKLLLDHVDSVLDIARFEAGKAALSTEPVQLDDLLQGIVDGQSSAADANGNSIDWSWVGTPLLWIETDPMRLQQILLNLVGNAIKFTRNGEVRIEVEQVVDAASGPELAFRVIDTGIGISEADLDKVFEDFHTTDASFGRRVGGTGLGLGIARRLVEAFGGSIGVESQLGEGSVFWFNLPARATTAPSQATLGTLAGAPRDSLDILLVEDNEINKLVIEEMLRNMGHRITWAENGKKGVDAAARHRFDLIFMDISMPVLDGLEATRQIRAAEDPSDKTPIVAVSANVMSMDQNRFIEAGMDGFLSKPLIKKDLEDLLDKVPSRKTLHNGMGQGGLAEDNFEQMRTELGDSVFEILKGRFLEEGDALTAWLDGDPSDLSEVARRCHKTAGSAAAFGALDFRDTLINIENAAKAEDVEKVAALSKTCKPQWTKIAHTLGQLPVP